MVQVSIFGFPQPQFSILDNWALHSTASSSLGFLFFSKIKGQRIAKSLCSDMQRGYTWRESHHNLFLFCQNYWSWRLTKESWLQRIHAKPLMDRSHICIFIHNFDIGILQHSVFFLAENIFLSREIYFHRMQEFSWWIHEEEYLLQPEYVFWFAASLRTHSYTLPFNKYMQSKDSDYDET